jgi:hypothetical protein
MGTACLLATAIISRREAETLFGCWPGNGRWERGLRVSRGSRLQGNHLPHIALQRHRTPTGAHIPQGLCAQPLLTQRLPGL